MTKTDNEKYVKRGADMFIEYNPECEGEVGHANKGKVGAPYRYSETLIMTAAALRVGLGVWYRQLEGTIGKMIGESKTPSFSQLRKRIKRLDVSTNRGGMITVPDRRHSRILAADATGLKQYNEVLMTSHTRHGFTWVEEHHPRDTAQGGPVQVEGRIDGP